MPSATHQPVPLPKWQRPKKTEHDLPWAELQKIDLSRFDEPGQQQKLAQQLRQAVQRDGFFSVVGTGFTEEEINRQYSIGQAFFDRPVEEKNKPELRCDFGQGNYFGYRACNEKNIQGTDVLDNVESVNIPKFIPELANEPYDPFLKPFQQEIEDFSRKSWEVVRKILTLFALILELPADYFVSRHLYSTKSEDHLRYMIYHPRSIADDTKVHNTWSRSHTDFGSLTLLWSQDVAGLQIRTHDGAWRYVAPVDGGIVCNVGDTLTFWSASYLRSTVHRVVRPPPDQDHADRLGLFYFVRPADDVDIAVAPSPLLLRESYVSQEQLDTAKPVKGLEYVRARVKSYHDHTDYKDMKGQKFRVGDLEIEDEIA